MAFGTDYRQAIILAVENQGEQAVNSLKASLKVVQEQIEGWNRALEAGTTSTTTHIAAVAKLVQVQGDLKAAIEVTQEAEGKAQRERIDGYARAERAAKESADAEKQAAGDAMRARIDAYARAERAREQADEAARISGIQAMGDRARAYAKEEQELEKVIAATERMKTTYISNAAAANFVARQARDLDSVMEGLAQHELAAAAATTTYTTAAQRQAQALKEAVAHTAGFSSAAAMATDQTQKYARATLNVAHAAQDWAQGGAAAMLNNIPLVTHSIITAIPVLDKMAASVGGPEGLAGMFTLAGTAAYVLYNQWTPLMTAMGASQGVIRPVLDVTADLKHKLEAASKVTEELGKKTHLSLAELREYKEATQKVKDFNAELEHRAKLEALLSGKSKAQREAGSAFQEALAESGGFVARDALDTAIGQTADAKGLVFNEVKGKMTSPKQLAGDLIEQAGEGDTRARGQVLDFLGKAYKPREGDFASKIRGTIPENVAKAKEQAQHDAEAERKRGQEADRKAREEEREEEKAQAHFDAEELRIQTAKAHFEAKGPAAEEAAQKKRDADAKRGKADFDRAARDAPRIAAHARDMGFAQEFQRVTGADDIQANYAGQQVGNLVEKGANPAQAMQQVFQKMMRELTEMKANEEAMLGMIGPATIQLQQMNQQNAAFRQRIGAVQGNQRRMGNQRPTRGIPF